MFAYTTTCSLCPTRNKFVVDQRTKKEEVMLAGWDFI
jgi:hypothetical protein